MEKRNLLVFSPHHDDAYWQTAGVSLYLKEAGWNVCFVTVIGDHYQWGYGKETYRSRAEEAARNFGVDHILLDFKSMEVQGPDARMAEQFTEIIRDKEPTIAITEYPEAIHPDHMGVAVNSMRALTKDWYGVERKLPQEVWCYQGYKKYPSYDFTVDVSAWEEQIRQALWYFTEFGEGEANGLWSTRRNMGFQECFSVAKADPECFTIAPQLFPGKVRFVETKIGPDMIF